MQKEIKEKEIITEEDIDKNNPAYNENREFYVYKHIRLDNNTCFYVGKGKGNRIYMPKRNNHHDNICNKYGYKVEIIQDNLNEKEAFELEREIIEDYVFVFGYGINIDGYNKGDNEIGCLTNCTWGGEGFSGMQLSEEHKKNISEARKGMQLSEEHKKNISEARKGMQLSEETKRKMSEKASKKVICATTGKIFNSQTEASNYYNVVRGNIARCCKGELKSAGKLPNGIKLQWKYVKDYNNEFKGILINPIIE